MRTESAKAQAVDENTLVEAYDALRIFLENVWRRHEWSDDRIEFVLGGLCWKNGAPVGPSEGWLTAVQQVSAKRAIGPSAELTWR
jgi:hypothetical protein